MEHPGQVIAELYRLEAQLGRGAMGRIWSAEHLRLRSRVAIKFLDASVAQHPEALDRFVREAQSAAAVRSAHVVQIYDCGIDNGVPYISMELLEGESLDRRLSVRGALSAAELCAIFGGVAQAVDTAHELGVVHRDLKPGNIFITRERDVEIAKVLDFGIAKLMHRSAGAAAAAGTSTGVMLGTPYYMSPEQVRGSRDLDQRTDLWSLAVIAFECLTGALPFRGDSVGDIIVQICTAAPELPSALVEVPPGFDEWFLRGTCKDPAGRFATAREMAQALAEIVARSPVGSDGRGAARRPQRTTVLPPEVAMGGAASTPAGAQHAGVMPISGAPRPPGAMPRTEATQHAGAGTLPPSQSTGPMTAAIRPAFDRAMNPLARTKRRHLGVAAAIALACVVSALVLWALPPRRVSSGLENARLPPSVSPTPASPSSGSSAPASQPSRPTSSPSGAPSSPSEVVHEARPVHEAQPVDEAQPVPSAEADLDPANIDGATPAPGRTPAAPRARRSASTSRADKQRARAGRKQDARRPRRRTAPKPPAASETRPDPDPFSDRQ